MKDTFWVAVDYGVVEEAKRMGVNMTLYQAGGYENLPKQLSQFDDCLAGNFDAIVDRPDLGSRARQEVRRRASRPGKPIISTVNPGGEVDRDSKMTVDFDTWASRPAPIWSSISRARPPRSAPSPGPSGSGWAEDFLDGFKKAVKGKSNVTMLGDKFGDSGVAVQLGLIQNALQAYPDMNVIWGCAPAAKPRSVRSPRPAGKDVLIMSSYENQAMLDP